MTKSLVFITGATGFIGAQVAEATLKAGYRVRLSVRKPEQEKVLQARYADFANDVETRIVPDLSNVESFSNALEGVDYVFHIASPMPGSGNNVHRDYVNPAVQATLACLKAALAHQQIKKVVIVSSALALAPVTALISKETHVKGQHSYEARRAPSMKLMKIQKTLARCSPLTSQWTFSLRNLVAMD